MNARSSAVAMVLFLSAMSSASTAQDSILNWLPGHYDEAVVGGITSFQIFVTDLNPELVRDGISQAQLVSTIQDVLKDLDIPFVPLHNEDQPTLSLIVFSSITESYGHAVSMQLMVLEKAVLSRNSSARTIAMTFAGPVWVANVPRQQVRTWLIDTVRELTNFFGKFYKYSRTLQK